MKNSKKIANISPKELHDRTISVRLSLSQYQKLKSVAFQMQVGIGTLARHLLIEALRLFEMENMTISHKENDDGK